MKWNCKTLYSPFRKFVGIAGYGSGGIGVDWTRSRPSPVPWDQADDDLATHIIVVVRVVPLQVQPLNCNRDTRPSIRLSGYRTVYRHGDTDGHWRGRAGCTGTTRIKGLNPNYGWTKLHLSPSWKNTVSTNHGIILLGMIQSFVCDVSKNPVH